MRLTRRAATLLVFLVPSAIVLAVGCMVTARYIRAAEARSARILSHLLTDVLHREVSIGSINLGPNSIEARDVRLAAGLTFAGSGEAASARHILLNTSLQRLVDQIRAGGVIRADAVVSYARARVSRDRRGVWSFEDLFRPRPGAKKTRIEGRIQFVDSIAEYEDAALPRLGKRAAPILRATSRRVDGSLDLYKDGSVSWTASVTGDPGQFGTGLVAGVYDTPAGTLHIGIDVRDAQGVQLARYLAPEQVTVAGGLASGHVTIFRPDRASKTSVTVDAGVRAVSGRVARIATPLSGVAGTVRFREGNLAFDVSGQGGSARLHAAGGLGLISPLTLNARFSASSPDLSAALAAVAPIKRLTLPKWAHAAVSASGTLSGPIDRLVIDATGSGALSGTPGSEVQVPAPVAAQFHIAGPATSPRVYATARADRLRYRETAVRRASLVASYDGKRWTADLGARAAGGTVAARATLRVIDGSPAYRVVVRARRIDLARAGIETDRRLAGTADADVFLEGTSWDDAPDGQAIVQVSGLMYDKLEIQDARASLRSTGKALLVDSLVADGASGRLVVSGELDLLTHDVFLNVEADRVELARLPLPCNDTRSGALAGQLFVRGGRVVGPVTDPRFECQATAIAPGVGQYQFDYAEAYVSGTQRRLALSNGLIWRLPATATLDAVALEPFSGHGLVRGSGQFGGLDIQDVARLAGVKLDAVGEASGQVAFDGRFDAPTVTVDPISVAGAGLGDLAPREVTGSVVLHPGGRFHAVADARDIDLFLPNAPISSYLVVEGRGDLHASLTGRLGEDAARSLAGQVTATTRGLTVSGQSLGDLSATALLADQVLTLRSSPDRSQPGARLGSADRGIDVTNLQVNIATGDYMVGARANRLPVDLIRAAVTRSPLASSGSGASATQWALPLSEPFAGTLDADVRLTGAAGKAVGSVVWSSPDLTFDGTPAERFGGRLDLQEGSAALSDFALQAGQTSLTASGVLQPGKSIAASAVLKKLPLARLAGLLPDKKSLAGLSGTADEVRLTIEGTPDAPDIHASATLTDLPISVAAEGAPAGGGAAAAAKPAPESGDVRAVVKHIDIDDAHLVGGKLGVRQIVAALSGTDGTASEYTVSASGTVDFDRKTSRIPPDARVTAALRLPEQDTGLLKALRPVLKQHFPSLLSLDIEGKIAGTVTYSGSLTEWSDPQKALSSGAILPDLRGDLTLQASRVRYADMRTILTDVDANVRFTGDRVVVGRNPATNRPFTATMAVIDAKTGKPDPNRISDPIELSGELPLRPDLPDVSPLRLTAKRLVFAEPVLPIFGSGSVIGEMSAPPPAGRKTATEPGLALTIDNTLLRPRISGTLHLRKTAIRLPNALDEETVEAPIGLLQPSFANIKLVVDDQVRIATSAVAVDVRTLPTQAIVLSGDIRHPRLEGSLSVDRGVLAFPTARFTISKGGRVDVRYPAFADIRLDRPGQGLDDSSLGITVDMTAVGHITATSAATGKPRRYTITVEARGPLNSGQAVDIAGSDTRVASADTQRALRLTFRSDPADLALTSAGLQRKITGVLGGQDAIEGLFRSDPRLARIFGDRVLGVVTANVLPDLFDRVGLTSALGLQELALDYNQLEQFSIQLSRNLAGPFDLSFWHRLGSVPLSSTSERGLWELKTSYRLGRGAQLSWTTNDQRTNAYLLEGVFRF